MAELLKPELGHLPSGDRAVAPVIERLPELIRHAPELSIVVPTFNERDNLPLLIDLLRKTLGNNAWEVIVVDDDSPDGTADLARTIGSTDPRIRCIRRVGRRGLAGACLEGALASQAPFVAVMDADLQHDQTLLLSMLKLLRHDDADLVVGTRFGDSDTVAAMSPGRNLVSRWAIRIANVFMRTKLTDPMSGFFMLKRSVIERLAHNLSTQGFKILLDVVMTAAGSIRVVELPYRFAVRHHGKSKLDSRAVLDFFGLVVAKATSGVITLQFVLFCMVGVVGIAVHFVALIAGLRIVGLPFTSAQMLATAIAIVSNFVMNNAITYRDRRLVGLRFVSGLFGFSCISLFGMLSNIGVSDWIFNQEKTWWIAGLAGATVSVVWNYAVSSMTIWRNS